MQAIQAEGIPCSVGECSEIYREPAFEDAGLAPEESLPNAKRLQETSLQLLVHPTLDASDMEDMVAATRKVMQVATN
jgi:dTDP-4-amino-4,6-dideoxygalactose transaminase